MLYHVLLTVTRLLLAHNPATVLTEHTATEVLRPAPGRVVIRDFLHRTVHTVKVPPELPVGGVLAVTRAVAATKAKAGNVPVAIRAQVVVATVGNVQAVTKARAAVAMARHVRVDTRVRAAVAMARFVRVAIRAQAAVAMERHVRVAIRGRVADTAGHPVDSDPVVIRDKVVTVGHLEDSDLVDTKAKAVVQVGNVLADTAEVQGVLVVVTVVVVVVTEVVRAAATVVQDAAVLAVVVAAMANGRVRVLP